MEILASYPRQHCSQYLQVLLEIFGHFGRDLGGVPTGVRVGNPVNPPMNTMIFWVRTITAPGKMQLLASYPCQHCPQHLRVFPEIFGKFGRDLGGVPTGVRVGRPLNAPMKTMIF